MPLCVYACTHTNSHLQAIALLIFVHCFFVYLILSCFFNLKLSCCSVADCVIPALWKVCWLVGIWSTPVWNAGRTGLFKVFLSSFSSFPACGNVLEIQISLESTVHTFRKLSPWQSHMQVMWGQDKENDNNKQLYLESFAETCWWSRKSQWNHYRWTHWPCLASKHFLFEVLLLLHSTPRKKKNKTVPHQ